VYRERGETTNGGHWTLTGVMLKGRGDDMVDPKQGTVKGERTPHGGHWTVDTDRGSVKVERI